MYKLFEVAERVRRHNPRALAVDIRPCRWNNHAVYDCIILSVNIARCIILKIFLNGDSAIRLRISFHIFHVFRPVTFRGSLEYLVEELVGP